MTQSTIQLPGLRELARAGVVREAIAIGTADGFGLKIRAGLAERTLITQRGQVRMFKTADAVAALVRDELGLGALTLDLVNWSTGR